MAALGPEDCATKVELAAALKRAKEQASVTVKLDPDTPRACFQVGEGFDRFMALRPEALSQSKSERGRPTSNGERNGSPELTKSGWLKFAQVDTIPSFAQHTAGATSWTNRGRFRCRSAQVASDRGRWRTRDSSGQCNTTEIARRFRAQLWRRCSSSLKNLPVVVSRRPRVTCRAHGCSNDRVRYKHVAVNREGNELVRHLTQAQSRLAAAQPKISQSPQAGPHR